MIAKKKRFIKEKKTSWFIEDMGKAITLPFAFIDKALGSQVNLKNLKVGYNIK